MPEFPIPDQLPYRNCEDLYVLLQALSQMSPEAVSQTELGDLIVIDPNAVISPSMPPVSEIMNIIADQCREHISIMPTLPGDEIQGTIVRMLSNKPYNNDIT